MVSVYPNAVGTMHTVMIADVAVIGGGAAGLSAALMLGRCRRAVVLFDSGNQRNRSARAMHGFLSRDGTPPGELLAIARQQLECYATVRVVDACVDDIERSGDAFLLHAAGEAYRASHIVLATGMRDEVPALEGLTECWGISAFTCPYCDGWELRDRALATWGTTRTSIELAQELQTWSEDLLICTGLTTRLPAHERTWLERNAARYDERTVRRLHHQDGQLTAIEFEDGECIQRDGIFFSSPLVQGSPLPEQLGCSLDARGHIAVDEGGRTSVPGVYAAGDAVTHLHQVVFAAASGARAAVTLNNDLVFGLPQDEGESAPVTQTARPPGH